MITKSLLSTAFEFVINKVDTKTPFSPYEIILNNIAKVHNGRDATTPEQIANAVIDKGITEGHFEKHIDHNFYTLTKKGKKFKKEGKSVYGFENRFILNYKHISIIISILTLIIMTFAYLKKSDTKVDITTNVNTVIKKQDTIHKTEVKSKDSQ